MGAYQKANESDGEETATMSDIFSNSQPQHSFWACGTCDGVSLQNGDHDGGEKI